MEESTLRAPASQARFVPHGLQCSIGCPSSVLSDLAIVLASTHFVSDVQDASR
jgi:hypothetical protein